MIHQSLDYSVDIPEDSQARLNVIFQRCNSVSLQNHAGDCNARKRVCLNFTLTLTLESLIIVVWADE